MKLLTTGRGWGGRYENRNRFKNEEEINNHINFIEEEIKKSEKDSRMLELRNWLNLIS